MPDSVDTSLDVKSEHGDSSLNAKLSTISYNEIIKILSMKNKDVIEQFEISDSDKEYYIGDDTFYVPLFRCENPTVYICFDGSAHDLIDDIISQANGTPYEIIPLKGTNVVFSEEFSFCIGDDIQNFKEFFGEGEFEEYSNLKGDKQTYHLKFHIDSIDVQFTSYDNEFADYLVGFSKETSQAQNQNNLKQ